MGPSKICRLVSCMQQIQGISLDRLEEHRCNGSAEEGCSYFGADGVYALTVLAEGSSNEAFP